MRTSGRAPKSECSSPSDRPGEDRRPHLLTGVPPRSASLPQALLGPHSTRGGLSPAGRDDERLGLGDAPAGRQLLTEHTQGRGLCLRAVLRLCQRLPRGGCALLGGEGHCRDTHPAWASSRFVWECSGLLGAGGPRLWTHPHAALGSCRADPTPTTELLALAPPGDPPNLPKPNTCPTARDTHMDSRNHCHGAWA